MYKISEIESIKIKKNLSDTINYIDSIFITAIETETSDIHIEPLKDSILIRFRQDWDFKIFDKIHKENTSAIITRLKVLAKVKIDENKKPQDGKIVFFYEKEDMNVDIRFSSLPTTYWEKIVMRILKPDDNLTNIEALWLIDINLEKVREALKSKYWIILVSWPTGSWKSTTLFWVLKNYNPLEYNISTLEDPIEYDIEYVHQSQVKPDIWYTFAAWLKSLVRQDPDIIMVGEIRDEETATLAVEAALTGHLVVSTIHTNSAPWTVQRLINMWVEPFLLSSAMKMIISQRLGKRICKHCKEEYKPTDAENKMIEKHLLPIAAEDSVDQITFYHWAGCEKCGWSGYKWRLWIHEVLIIEDYLEPMILDKKSANEIKEEAIKHWMITIVQDWLIKATFWDTTIEEALKLI